MQPFECQAALGDLHRDCQQLLDMRPIPALLGTTIATILEALGADLAADGPTWEGRHKVATRLAEMETLLEASAQQTDHPVLPLLERLDTLYLDLPSPYRWSWRSFITQQPVSGLELAEEVFLGEGLLAHRSAHADAVQVWVDAAEEDAATGYLAESFFDCPQALLLAEQEAIASAATGLPLDLFPEQRKIGLTRKRQLVCQRLDFGNPSTMECLNRLREISESILLIRLHDRVGFELWCDMIVDHISECLDRGEPERIADLGTVAAWHDLLGRGERSGDWLADLWEYCEWIGTADRYTPDNALWIWSQGRRCLADYLDESVREELAQENV